MRPPHLSTSVFCSGGRCRVGARREWPGVQLGVSVGSGKGGGGAPRSRGWGAEGGEGEGTPGPRLNVQGVGTSRGTQGSRRARAGAHRVVPQPPPAPARDSLQSSVNLGALRGRQRCMERKAAPRPRAPAPPSPQAPASFLLPARLQCPSPRPRPPATPPGRGARSPVQQTWSRLPGPWGETWVVGTGRASLSGSWNLGAARAAGLSGQWKKASWAWRVLGAWGEPACRSAWGEDCSGPGGPQCLGHRAAALGIRTWWSPRTDPWTGTLGAYLTF